MAAVANDFYATYASLPRTGGIPDATARVRYAPLLSPRLTKLIAGAETAETRFMKQNKDSPPLIEGDLFSSLFEGATGVQARRLQRRRPDRPVQHRPDLSGQNEPQSGQLERHAVAGEHPGGLEGGRYRLQGRVPVRQYRALSDTLKMAISEAP